MSKSLDMLNPSNKKSKKKLREEEIKKIRKEEIKTESEGKKKRGFVLSQEAIYTLEKLKFNNYKHKNYSEIVEEALFNLDKER